MLLDSKIKLKGISGIKLGFYTFTSKFSTIDKAGPIAVWSMTDYCPFGYKIDATINLACVSVFRS